MIGLTPFEGLEPITVRKHSNKECWRKQLMSAAAVTRDCLLEWLTGSQDHTGSRDSYKREGQPPVTCFLQVGLTSQSIGISQRPSVQTHVHVRDISHPYFQHGFPESNQNPHPGNPVWIGLLPVPPNITLW